MAITPGGLRLGKGFTLVEVLVTLAVIGLGLGLISLTLGHDSATQLRTESDRLRTALEHAGSLAQWRRSDLAFEAVADGYRFLHPAADGRWEVTGWIKNAANKLYRMYNLDLSGFIGVNQGVYGPPRTYGAEVVYHIGG